MKKQSSEGTNSLPLKSGESAEFQDNIALTTGTSVDGTVVQSPAPGNKMCISFDNIYGKVVEENVKKFSVQVVVVVIMFSTIVVVIVFGSHVVTLVWLLWLNNPFQCLTALHSSMTMVSLVTSEPWEVRRGHSASLRQQVLAIHYRLSRTRKSPTDAGLSSSDQFSRFVHWLIDWLIDWLADCINISTRRHHKFCLSWSISRYNNFFLSSDHWQSFAGDKQTADEHGHLLQIGRRGHRWLWLSWTGGVRQPSLRGGVYTPLHAFLQTLWWEVGSNWKLIFLN